MCKRDQVKKDEVLTTPEMLEDYKKKPRHSKQKQKRKIRMTQLVTFIVHCRNYMQRRKCDDNYVCPKCVPADTDLDHDLNCFKCSG